MDDVSTKSLDYSPHIQGFHNLTGFQDTFGCMQNGSNPNHLLLASQILPQVISESSMNSLSHIITNDDVCAFVCKTEASVNCETSQNKSTINLSTSVKDFVRQVSPLICDFQPQLDSISVLAAATANINSNFPKNNTANSTTQEETSDATIYCADKNNLNLINSSIDLDTNLVEKNVSPASIHLHLASSSSNDSVNSFTIHTKPSNAPLINNIGKASPDVGPFLYAPQMAHFKCEIPLSVEISPPSVRSDFNIASSPISSLKYELSSSDNALTCRQSGFMPFVEDGLSSCGSASESLTNSPRMANNMLSSMSRNARESSVCSSDSGLLSHSLVRDITDDIREIKRAIVDNADLPPILSRYTLNGSSDWSLHVNGNTVLPKEYCYNSDSVSCDSSADFIWIQQDSECADKTSRLLAPRNEHIGSVVTASQISSNEAHISSASDPAAPVLKQQNDVGINSNSTESSSSSLGLHAKQLRGRVASANESAESRQGGLLLTDNDERLTKTSRGRHLSTQSSSEEDDDCAIHSHKGFLSRLSRAKYNRLPDHESTPPPTSGKTSLQQRFFSKALQSSKITSADSAVQGAKNAGPCATAFNDRCSSRSLDGADFTSDEDTEKLLTKQYGTTGCSTKDSVRLNSVSLDETGCSRSGVLGAPHLDIPELQREREVQERRRRGREVAVRHPDEPAVLIEGVIFRAAYLGSTQLVSEGQPNKATRMLQAQEAVGRIKASDGENQPSVAVDLFISTEKMMVLNTNLQEIMMDHSLKSISYIADIGDVLVVMARRRYLSASVDNSPEIGASLRRRQAQVVCHVFESDEASLIAQSIGHAFQMAYMEFLRANGIEDPSVQLKNMDYQDVLNQQEIFSQELSLFSDKQMQKEVIVPKLRNEALGVVIVESGWGSMIPTVVLANMHPTGPAARCGQLNIGDQIICVNCVSCVGLPLVQCQNLLKNCRQNTAVKLTIVSCPPVVEVLIKRPDAKYQLGFSVQNGVICSLLRGGIAERGGVRVGHRIIEINHQSMVAVSHERIVNILASGVGEIHMKTMPTSIFRLLTGQEVPHYI